MHLNNLTAQEAEKALFPTGLLYVINKNILHPCGLALAFCYDDDDIEYERPVLALCKSDDGEPIEFNDPVAEKEYQEKLEAYIFTLPRDNQLALITALTSEYSHASRRLREKK